MQYSFTKGLSKGAVSLLSIAGALVVFSGFADITLWDLLTTYFKPIFSSLTVGGAITMAINYLKIKAK